ncbi:MAG: hydroxymethylbilane synthase [candidate division Zixibacteria bacterium]
MKIGTRGSDLATTQTGTVAKAISDRLGIEIKQVLIKTKGDIITDRPLRELEGRGYFTKELEEALLDGRIDLAVHSFKDMPSECPDGLVVAAISKREDPADLIIIDKDAYQPDSDTIPVKQKAVVGTSAVRRERQIRAIRSDLEIKDLRGNVPTRLRKLAEGQYDAIFLASAGVRRLGLDLSAFEVARLDPLRFVPSPGQGALAIQMRSDDKIIDSVREIIHDREAADATRIERDVMALFGGGCGLPLGVYAWRKDDLWHARGFWGGDTENYIWEQVEGDNPERLGNRLYKTLTKSGK